MTLATETAAPAADERDLVLTRLIDAPPEKVYRCWTQPALLKQWFAPAPLTTPHAELDVRVGGENFVVMKLPDGTEMPNRGAYLEVVPNQKLVWTDAYAGDWRPKDGAPFMTVILTFEEAGPGRTRYTARVRHWTLEGRKRHEEMGFEAGWGQCADQLAALAARI